MKTGRSVDGLAAELLRQKETKHDYIADTRKLRMTAGESSHIRVEMELPQGDTILDVTPLCHTQIGQHVHIPKPYYDRMRSSAPELLAENVNHWLHSDPANRMVRTLDNNARAFLSNKYRPLDNADLMEAIYPKLEQTELNIQSCELTETRMYIKAVSERVHGDVKVGDTVQAGIVISNSEVGSGALSIQPLLYRLVCLNGMIRNDHQMRRVHTGSRHNGGDDAAWELYSDRTREQSDKAIFMQARDLVDAFLKPDFFNTMLDELRAATKDAIVGDDIPKIVERTAKSLSLKEDESNSVLKRLVEGGDLTRWGMANAITNIAHDVEDYDRATELERIGGQVIELPQKDWATLVA